MSLVKKHLVLTLVILVLVVFIVSPTLWYGFMILSGQGPNSENSKLLYNTCGNIVPVSAPFPVEVIGNQITCDFLIEQHEVYIVILRYLYDTKNTAEIRRIQAIANGEIEGVAVEGNGPISISYIITSLDTGAEIKNGVAKGPRLLMATDEWAAAKIAAADLQPGRYQLQVKNLKTANTLQGIGTEVSVQMQGGK